MNTIQVLIEKENLTLVKDYGDQNYTYHVGKQMITYPAFDDLNQPDSIFSIAHELGHHYQRQQYNLLLILVSALSRKKDLSSLILFPFLFWEEIDAWKRAWKICRKKNIPIDGFTSCMFKALMSYVTGYFSKIIRVLKYVLALYISCVFWIRFMVISEEMKLQQPEWLKEIRQMIINSSQSQSEIISDMFYIFLTTYIIMMFVFFLGKILFAYGNFNRI